MTSLAKAKTNTKVKTNIRTREQRNYSEEELKEEQKFFFNEFKKDLESQELTKETIRGYLSNVKIFFEFLRREKVSILEVDKFVLRDFLRYLKNERKNSVKRMENYFTSLSAFFEFLDYEGYYQGNPAREVRKRYLKRYKSNNNSYEAKVISVEEMGAFINSITDIRDKAIVTLFVKTGIRRGELQTIELGDINWEEQSILLKPRKKRSNRKVFFDDETAIILKRWLRVREKLGTKSKALFPGKNKEYIDRNSVYEAVTKWAKRFGIHDDKSKRREDHFSPHNLRHCFTTYLRQAGMPREYIQELRGDARGEAIDIYTHILPEDLRREYLARVPKFDIC